VQLYSTELRWAILLEEKTVDDKHRPMGRKGVREGLAYPPANRETGRGSRGV
jgi:hypothetical protein